MTTAAIIIAVIAAISAGLWAMCAFAPKGYQDETGFNYGEPE